MHYDIIIFQQNLSAEYRINIILKRELSPFSFINGVITEIISDEAIKAIDEVFELGDPFKPVTEHIKTALKHLSDRKNPDYRNSIKESISAVEALCQIITQDKNAELGKALKKVEKKIKIAPALKSGLSKIYGYTNSEDGIRHALSEESDVDIEDATFMLVSCSAFIHYLISKSNKAGIF